MNIESLMNSNDYIMDYQKNFERNEEVTGGDAQPGVASTVPSE